MEILGVLIGTIVGGLITWFTTAHWNRLQTTFDLHREFDSDVMHESRMSADQLIKGNPHDTLGEIYKKDPEKSRYLWQLINFYRRLSLAIKYNQVNPDLIPELFGEIFTWWYIVCFENQLLADEKNYFSPSRKQIFWLKKWLDTHANKTELSKWTANALDDLQNYRQGNFM
ncbi:hypothetical protein [Leptolyngbya sp. FACHB-261]|uniref:DUF4760 domain-containing protein n=1 Tax=Leptolyngbya sp. FACHB-261 TaxID=2692806 RepID=UPI001683B33D|nr:hypothetical protein [Leptolyngbya sp. FACHB-261]MBD2104826.1 hypothetical protein [Leptolyngbya sp. FACHB-261]